MKNNSDFDGQLKMDLTEEQETASENIAMESSETDRVDNSILSDERNNNERDTKSKKDKKVSFSDSINFLVVLSFGIAFLIIYIASVILLIMNGEIDHSFYIKTIFMFLVFLIIYIASSLLVTIKIRRMFRPLDKLAHGLLTDEIRVYGDSDDIKKLADNLKNDMLRLENISKELNDTKSDLNEAHTKALKEQNSMESSLSKSDKYILGIEKAKEHLKSDFRKEKQIYEEMPLLIASMNQSKTVVGNSTEELNESIKYGLRCLNDTGEDLQNSSNAYNILIDMLNENIELIENLFSELTFLQGVSSQINLYSSNLSLEFARTGILNSSMSAAMEDMKGAAKKINEKTDSIAMLIIRARNANRLAQDQADFCKDQMDAGANSFGECNGCLNDISKHTTLITNSLDNLTTNLDRFANGLFDLQAIMNSKNKELAQLEDQNLKLKKQQKSMQIDLKK